VTSSSEQDAWTTRFFCAAGSHLQLVEQAKVHGGAGSLPPSTHTESMQPFDISRCEDIVQRLCGETFLSALGTPMNTPFARRIEGPDEFRAVMQDPTYRELFERLSSLRGAVLAESFGMSWLAKQHPSDLQALHMLLEKQKVETRIKAVLKRQSLPIRDKDGCDFVWMLAGTVTWVIMDRVYGFETNDSFSLRYEEGFIQAGRLPCGWVGELPEIDARPGKLRDFKNLTLSQIVGEGMVCVL
jgi:hypothetical protein